MTQFHRPILALLLLSLAFSPLGVVYGVATVQGTSTNAKVQTIHTDHLGGTRAVTEYDGDTSEVLDYYPFGLPRVTDEYTFNEKKKFTGHEYDEETGVYYMGARYYEPEVKRFLSQDPVHILIGDHRFEEKFNRRPFDILKDPQQLNSYSYVANNPIVNKDKDGKVLETVADVGFVAYDLYSVWTNAREGDIQGTLLGLTDLALDSLGLATPFVPAAFGVTRRAAETGAKMAKGGGGCLNCGSSALKWMNNSSSFGKSYTRFVSTKGGIVDLKPTVDRIKAGEKYPHKNDGGVFQNRERLLPNKKDANYYREYVVATPGSKGPGTHRLIVGKSGEIYYSPDHYETAIKVGP